MNQLYCHCDVILMMTSRAYCARSPRSHYDVILIETSFATELVTPTVTDECTYVTNTLPRLIYKDTQQLQLFLSKHTSYNANTSPIYLNIQKCNVFDNGNFDGWRAEFLTSKREFPVALPCKGTTAPSLFGPCLMWPNSWMDQDQDTTWYGCASAQVTLR